MSDSPSYSKEPSTTHRQSSNQRSMYFWNWLETSISQSDKEKLQYQVRKTNNPQKTLVSPDKMTDSINVQDKPTEDLVHFGPQEDEKPPIEDKIPSADTQIKTEEISDSSRVVSDLLQDQGIVNSQKLPTLPQDMTIPPAEFILQDKPTEDLVHFGSQEDEKPPIEDKIPSADTQIKTEEPSDSSHVESERKGTDLLQDQGVVNSQKLPTLPQDMTIPPAEFILQAKSAEDSFSNAQRRSKFLAKIPDGFQDEILEMRKKREQVWREDLRARVKADEVELLVKSKCEMVETLEGIVNIIYEQDPEGKMINQSIRENEEWYKKALKNDNGYLDSLTKVVAKTIEGEILQGARQETKVLNELSDQEIAEEVTSIMSGLFLYYIWHKNFLKESERCDKDASFL